MWPLNSSKSGSALPAGSSVAGSPKTSWSPPYVRRRVFAIFATGFIILGIAVEFLLHISDRRQGLVTTRQDLHYLWTYGPTVILTLVTTFWSRVEFQSKMMAPWSRLANGGAEVDQTLLADYLSMFQPYAIVKAAANKDYAVAAFSAISITLRVLIVISTGLIALSPTQVSHAVVPIVIQSEFTNDPTDLETGATLPYYVVSGISDFDLPFPDGLSDRFAFQSFKSNLPPATQLNAIVNGFAGGLDCEAATLNITEYDTIYNFTLHSRNCQFQRADDQALHDQVDANYFTSLVRGNCTTGPNAGSKRVGVVFWDLAWGLSSLDSIKQPNQLLDEASPLKLDNVTSWDIMQAIFDMYYTLASQYSKRTDFGGVPVVLDGFMGSALRLRNKTTPSLSVSSLLDETVLQDTVTDFYRQISAIVAHSSLMRPAAIASTGSAITEENRLIVRELAAHLMAALCFLCVLIGIVFFTLPNLASVLPRNPNTLINMALLLANSRELLMQIPRLGATNIHTLRLALGGTQYHSKFLCKDSEDQECITILPTRNLPSNDELELVDTKGEFKHPLILSTVARAGVSVLTIGLIVTLEVLLQVSRRQEGLGDVRNEDYLHYSWTTVPAIAFGLLGLYLGAVDFECRRLTPFINLSRGASFDRSIGLDLLDRTAPFALHKEIRSKNYATLAITIAGAIPSFFTIFSSSLFTAISLPTSSNVQLQTTDLFSFNMEQPSSLSPNPADFVAALILESNLSYPGFTHEELAFPKLKLLLSDSDGILAAFDQSRSVINATVPALRSKLACQSYEASQMESRFNGTMGRHDYVDVFTDCASNGEYFRFIGYISASKLTADRNFFEGPDFSTDSPAIICGRYRWAWGRAEQGNVTLVGGLACNETLETVEVQTLFFGSNLRIDPGHPPMPLDLTARVLDLGEGWDAGEYLMYENLPYMLSPTGEASKVAAVLTTSRYAVPVEALGDPARVLEVAGQCSSNIACCLPSNSDESDYNVDFPPVAAATITDPLGRRRVIQDAASTRVIEALLGVALACSLLGWVGMRNTNVLPRSPTSIASIAALLVDGNLFYYLSQQHGEANTAHTDASTGFARGAVFRLGWATATDASGCEDWRFGIFCYEGMAPELDHAKEKRMHGDEGSVDAEEVIPLHES
ncbi:hypothetical protein NPX13_g1718 [Xylaria arbuscula]|uniref:Uncharacterized protein n=1 Tax=Xylaria arbuscula TaxID=114810 RepID=A0A9W8TR14_9PEZI|nr:hypothetical protein NPX13_g1718 [Xylaria arbuscula]